MITRRFFLGFAVLRLFAAGSIEASAQSFDCGKASTPIERLICADRELGALDTELAAELKKALAAVPAAREELLFAERQWLRERDRSCAVSSGTLTAETRARGVACLAAEYRNRIGALRSAGAGATEICKTIGDYYRALLDGDPQAPFKKSFYAASPLDTLAAASAGVTVAKPVAEIEDYSRRKIVDWAQGQPRPFAVAADVATALDEIAHSALRIDRLPGANYFAASVIEGTAACYSAVYFEAERGRARLIDGPGGWEGEAAGVCGVTRSFGTIDKTPVAFEERHDYTPSLTSSLSVTPWTGSGFGPTCLVTFAFAPRFDPHGTYNSWEESCEGADCDELRRGALALVEQAQRHPLEARKAAIAGLTAPQLGEFTELQKQAGPAQEREPSEATDPVSYTDNAPLLLPLVHDGRVYLAGLGHFTIGWRIFSDWSVTLRRLENGNAKERATLAIGATKGRLEKISVK